MEPGFTAGQVTSVGATSLLRQAERRINLTRRSTGCFSDGRNPELIEHTLMLLAQRIYGLAVGV